MFPQARRGGFARRGRGQGRSRNGRRNQTGGSHPNSNRNHMGRRPRRNRGRTVQTNRHNHVVPPASFTRSSIGREMETVTVKTSYSATEIEIYDKVMKAWSTGANTAKNCVTRTYVNKSGMAADLSGATPVSTTSKRTITHVTGVRVQGHSTVVSAILAGGKKIYNANSTTQRNVNLKQVESRHQISKYHTPSLHLPGKADLVNQKGYKLVKQTIAGLGTLEFDYGHIGDFLTSVSHHELTTGDVCSIDFSANIHSVPNPGYAPDSSNPGKVVSPPDFIFVRSKDPTLLLQGFNESTEETTLMTRDIKDVEIFSITGSKYLAKTDIVNILPQPSHNGIYRLPRPVQISKSTNIIASLTLAVYFNNPLDHDEEEMRLYLFENIFDYFENANGGTVSRSLISVPSGTVMYPRQQVSPFSGAMKNERGEEYRLGGRYMFIDMDSQGDEIPQAEDEEESDSEISIISSGLSNTRIDAIPKTRKRLLKERMREIK